MLPTLNPEGAMPCLWHMPEIVGIKEAGLLALPRLSYLPEYSSVALY